MDVEQRWARRLASLRAVLLRDVDRIWRDLFKPEDVPGSMRAIGPLVAARCKTAQGQGVEAATAYADAVLRQAFGDAALPVWVPPDWFVGLDRHGRAYPTMLAGAPEVYAKRVASGMDPETAAGREQTFARRLAGSIVHDTARELLTGLADPDSAISHPQVESWARVAGPKACDFCVMLAGRGYVYTSRDTAMMADSGKRYHDHCSCGVAIGPAGMRSPTAEQQYRAWVADGSRTQWGAGARRATARPSTIPPAVPHTPAELHKMADDLEHFAATVETRLPDAAAKARARAAQLRADAR